jgi:hypothetical protein
MTESKAAANKPKNPSKKRLPGGKGTEVARQRQELYGAANVRLKSAYEAGFYIECVAICESIICDRLEARLQFLSRNTTKLAPVLSLGFVIKAIGKSGLETEPNLFAAYEKISIWAEARNDVVHQFVKRTDVDKALSAEERQTVSRATAETGIELMKEISRLVRRHNKWEASKEGDVKAR